jgi:CheY-like chemotaxis protein
MTPSVRARAFEPFFTTKDVGRGTGLGLSQVFGFVRQLGGHVTIDSAPGDGTRVTMFLPEATRAFVARPPPAPEPAPIPTDATVLVVEDDPNICDVTAEMLRDAGFRVRTAADGTAALDILRSGQRVDLLFTDVILPGGATGIDLARSVHELRPNLAVLLTTGYDAPALSRFGGYDDYEVLAKPYTRALLLQRISAVISGSPVA